MSFGDKAKLYFTLGERSFQRKISNITLGNKYQLVLDENLDIKKLATTMKEKYK